MDNFLARYMKFSAGNEVPDSYNMWCGLSALSSIISRRVWLNMGHFQVYPNLYVVLDGPPGVKKTTAMSIAKGLIRNVGNIPFSAEAQTKESLVQEMEENVQTFRYKDKPTMFSPLSIFVTELSHFLGFDAGPMVDFLVTVYDAPVYDKKTKGSGSNLVPGPYVTLLGCTTPSWVATYLRTDVISGGFSRRAVFVYEEFCDKRVPFPFMTDEQKALGTSLIAQAHKIQSITGPFMMTEECKEHYTHWYMTRKKSIDPVMQSWSETKPTQLLKLGMLLAVGEEGRTVLESHHFEAALAMLNQVEANLPRVFRGLGRNELSQVGVKLKDILIKAGGMLTKKQLEALMWDEANARDLQSVITHLVSTGELYEFGMKRKGEKVAKRYLATQARYQELKASAQVAGPKGS